MDTNIVPPSQPRDDTPPPRAVGDYYNVNIGENAQVGQIAVGENITQTQITNNFFGDRAQERNRRDMLELVTNTWIKGVLEQSLYKQVLLELGLQTQPGAVERSWDMQLQMPDQPNGDLPVGTPIVQIFDQFNGALLILGAPGAGKTTMLLQLARDLIARARQDPLMRIPVVLNLSSWSDPNQPIADWLVFALGTQYQVSKKLAQAWVEQDALLLLLDGLDEVDSERRDACVKAINTFRGEHGSMPLVVSSRIADYQALKTQLNLRGAVVIQPLTTAQIDAYLDRAGPELAAVRQMLTQDTVLQELVQQPLMLGILSLAYRGISATDLSSERFATLESRRKHLFDTYIDRMFHRTARARNEPYSPAQTKHWLNWLAQKMIEHGQSLFFLESLRRSWLPTLTQVALALLLVAIVSGLVGWLAGGLVVGLVFGMVVAWVGFQEPSEQVKWRWEKARSGLRKALVGGLIIGLIVGLVVGLGGGLIGGLVFGLSVGLVIGLGGGLALGLVIGLVSGLEVSVIETKTSPNQGIRQSMKNSVLVGLVVELGGALVGALVGSLGGGLVVGLGGGLVDGLRGGLVAALPVALGLALVFGGAAVINHYIVRLILSRNNSMPLNYVRFLDYASERILLRKVGGGYIFIHRMLLEHFAAMEPHN